MNPALSAPLAAQLSREEARDAARRELQKPEYARDDPTLIERVLLAVGRRISELFERAAGAGPGSRIGALLLILLLVLVLLVVRYRVGPLARKATIAAPLLGGRTLTAGQYRAAAAGAAAAGDDATALRDQLRAIAAEAEFRGVLEPRAGRTADELGAELAAAIPGLDLRLRAAVVAFDQVWYGGRRAGRADYEAAVAADRALVDRLSSPVPR